MGSSDVVIVTFVALAKGGSGPVNAALTLAKTLHEEGRLHRIVCPDYDPEALEFPAELIETPPSRLFHKLFNRSLRWAGRVFAFSDRRLREEVFDAFVSRSPALRGARTALFLKPGFPRTVAAASTRGIRTLGWASILHPEFNRRQVLQEDARWGIAFESNYGDARRAKSLSRFFEALDLVLVASDVAWRNFADEGIPEHRLRLVPGAFGVDCERFAPAPADEQPSRGSRPLEALHISNMNVIKGVGYLLEAWKQADLEGARLRLGGGLDRGMPTLIEQIATPSVELLGSVQDTPARYREADVFVSPSISDNLPNTVLEAMACGTPVIVSDMCGLCEIVDHGVDGFVYSYDDVDALAGHLRWCHEHPEALATMGRRAREKAERFPKKDFARQLLRAIDSDTQARAAAETAATVATDEDAVETAVERGAGRGSAR